MSLQRYTGPVLRAGDIADAVVEAIREDNADKPIIIESRASYVRVKVGGECVIRRETVERHLGRPFELRELEIHMPSFAGYIRTGTDSVRFVLGQSETSAVIGSDT
ncbi:MAG TPA: MmoB/DmpM family protein [Steroidobacteraceae bacterium]|nr:MmoB/DmpM family protein [Steroidobacteraceae bacterium]